MKKSIKVQPKKRGRPATGKDPLMGFRAPPDIRAAIVKWAEGQPDNPTLSEAIRQLVELGLSTAAPRARTSAKTAAEAKEMAAHAIDRLVDPAAPADEKANRKSRLLKGPEEFRDLRVDHSKKNGPPPKVGLKAKGRDVRK